MPPRARPNRWRPGGACRLCACSTITPTRPPPWPNTTLEGPVLALAWDGTGYGSDGTVWGGEALRCEGAEFTRVAHLRTFSLPGGDQAMHEPRRSALGLLYEILGEEAGRFAAYWFKDDRI